MADSDAIADLIERVNEAWRGKRYDDIGTLVDNDVVIAPPGTPDRIRGRDAYVQSYRDYDAAARTIEFTPEPPLVDVIGSIAVAICPFRVVYELGETVFREAGRDLLVFVRKTDGWRIVWRSMVTDPPV
jgi:ketosteroid isomerase-like protein